MSTTKDSKAKKLIPGKLIAWAAGQDDKEPGLVLGDDGGAPSNGSRPVHQWWFLPRSKAWPRVLCPSQW